MKKYILLAGVALATMTANNVMASWYVDIDVTATIEKYEERDCSDFKFGTIKILSSEDWASSGATSAEAKVIVTYDDDLEIQGATVDNFGFGILSVTDYQSVTCGPGFTPDELPESVEIKNGDSTLTVSDFTSDGYDLGGTLTIPDVNNVESGDYAGSFTVYKIL